jgi:hypothetical protein
MSWRPLRPQLQDRQRNHDLAVVLDEALLNLIATRFFQGRPQLFRRISKGMDGVTPFDPVLDPLKIGETGYVIQYEFRITAPPDGNFIDLYPAQDTRTNTVAAPGQILFKCGVLIRLWDPIGNIRWQFPFPVTVTCVPTASGQNEYLDAQAAAIVGLVPPPFQNAVDYALLHLIKGALKNLILPGNFLVDPPASVTIHIADLSVANNLLQVDADVSF